MEKKIIEILNVTAADWQDYADDTRQRDTHTIFAVRVSAANDVYDAMHTLDSMHCAAAARLAESVARLTASTERFIRKYFAYK